MSQLSRRHLSRTLRGSKENEKINKNKVSSSLAILLENVYIAVVIILVLYYFLVIPNVDVTSRCDFRNQSNSTFQTTNTAWIGTYYTHISQNKHAYTHTYIHTQQAERKHESAFKKTYETNFTRYILYGS